MIRRSEGTDLDPIYVSALPPPEPEPFGAVPRSPHWPTVRAAFLREHPACAVCGTKDDLEAHHCRPYHLDNSLELVPGNLLPLCRVHHLWWGHLGNWSSFNETVREDAAVWQKKIEGRP